MRKQENGSGGETSADSPWPVMDCSLRFQNQWEDEESGLYYNLNRYYDPDSGQYLSTDPIGLEGGLRTHGYVHDPMQWVDPMGLAGVCPRGPNRWNSFQKSLANARVKVNRTTAARIWDHLENRSVGRMGRPTVTDTKLQNIVNDLYKGDSMPHVLGNGSTADAARIESISGQRIYGRDHITKAGQYSNALNNWVRRNSGASVADQGVAGALLNDLQNALTGR